MIDVHELVEFLSEPAAYPDAPAKVERIETHISWVFLTDSFVYKLKKPVRFDFLDFSTLDLRRAACEDEVRLNRRLAVDTYLGVLSITDNSEGRLTLGGSGRVIDYVVKMKRLPADCSLDRLLAAGRITDVDVDRLAARLAEFYRSRSSLPLEPGEYRRKFEAHVRANLRDLSRFAPRLAESLVKETHGAQLRFLALMPEVLDVRVTAGRVVEGHGDLRPEHVYLLPEPVALDCIEFNEEYRRIDVLDELGFLAMECDRIGAAKGGATILSKALQALDDNFPPALLAFYKTYRACVRAKVAALRGGQHAGGERESALAEAAAYLELARREATPLPGPIVVLVRGLSGSGKSTIAAALAERLGAEWLSTDLIRREARGIEHRDVRYLPERRAAIYEDLFGRAESHLGAGLAVVLDGTFLKADLCRRAKTLAREFSTSFLAVECNCPENVARERMAQRQARGDSVSEAFPELLETQQREQERLPSDMPCCAVDTTAPTEESVRSILAWLSSDAL